MLMAVVAASAVVFALTRPMAPEAVALKEAERVATSILKGYDPRFDPGPYQVDATVLSLDHNWRVRFSGPSYTYVVRKYKKDAGIGPPWFEITREGPGNMRLRVGARGLPPRHIRVILDYGRPVKISCRTAGEASCKAAAATPATSRI
jgi:hypothetical protein